MVIGRELGKLELEAAAVEAQMEDEHVCHSLRTLCTHCAAARAGLLPCWLLVAGHCLTIADCDSVSLCLSDCFLLVTEIYSTQLTSSVCHLSGVLPSQ